MPAYRFLVADGRMSVEILRTGEVMAYAMWRAMRDVHRNCCQMCPYSYLGMRGGSGKSGANCKI